MKKILLTLCIVSTLLLSCNYIENQKDTKKEKSQNQYSIQGNIPNSNGKTIILLDSAENVIQQIEITNNEFLISGTPKVSTAFLRFQDGEKTPVFLDASVYNVRVWDNNPNRLFVESKKHKQLKYNAYQQKIENFNRELLEAYDENNEGKIVRLHAEKDILKQKFIEQHNGEFIGLFELNRQKNSLTLEKTAELFSTFNEDLKNTCLGVDLEAEIEKNIDKDKKEKKTPAKVAKAKPKQPVKSKESERIPAPQFSGLSPEGHLMDLQTIISQNKIIMLDFWGSWCQPCRMQNPFWIRLYRKYKNKGFEIVSIAEETEESRPFLETAIQEDKMTWKHIIDENYEIAELYGAHSLPHAVLISDKGKLIYHKASARDIQEFLQDYFRE